MMRQEALAEFDAQAILDAIDAGAALGTWTVYRAKRSYLLGQGFLFLALALVFVVLAAITIGAVIPTPFSSGTDDLAWALFLFVMLGVVCSIMAIAFCWTGINQLRQMRTATTQILVLTPEGIVARMWRPVSEPVDASTASYLLGHSGTGRAYIYAVAYEQVRAVILYVEHAKYETIISLGLSYRTRNQPIKVSWLVDPRFGTSEAIAQSIIEAHTRYTAQHTEA